MEKFTDSKQEKSLKEAAINALRFLGIDDPDAKAVLAKWREEEEREIDQTPEEDRVDAEVHSLLYEAEIYFDAGYKKEALDILKDAADMAMEEKLFDVAEKISLKMQEYGK